MWSLPDCNLLYCIVIKEVNEVFGVKNRMSTARVGARNGYPVGNHSGHRWFHQFSINRTCKQMGKEIKSSNSLKKRLTS